jgi:hypothetical protein
MVWSLELEVLGLGLSAQGLGCMVQELRVKGSGYRVKAI